MQFQDPATLEPFRSDDERLRTLVAQVEMLRAAAAVAWSALVEAYRPSADGMIRPTPDLLQRYHNACAMRAAAETELHALLQPQPGCKADGSNDPA